MSWKIGPLSLVVIAAMTAAWVCLPPSSFNGQPLPTTHQTVPPATSRHLVTFNRDVAPILFKDCAPCHRPGESGPFSLLNYEDARRHAHQIVVVTNSRFMPPWLPAPGYGAFVGDRRLTQSQIDAFKDWVVDGELQGDAKDLPPAPHFVPGWQLGKPDLVLKMTRP
ncbi:MAG: alkyl hydroperoxide reductase, partial [Candidatus Dormibacteraceae bacterium]